MSREAELPVSTSMPGAARVILKLIDFNREHPDLVAKLQQVP
jgi:hypothetical protein